MKDFIMKKRINLLINTCFLLTLVFCGASVFESKTDTMNRQALEDEIKKVSTEIKDREDTIRRMRELFERQLETKQRLQVSNLCVGDGFDTDSFVRPPSMLDELDNINNIRTANLNITNFVGKLEDRAYYVNGRGLLNGDQYLIHLETKLKEIPTKSQDTIEPNVFSGENNVSTNGCNIVENSATKGSFLSYLSCRNVAWASGIVAGVVVIAGCVAYYYNYKKNQEEKDAIEDSNDEDIKIS
jgi:hypothetical protein